MLGLVGIPCDEQNLVENPLPNGEPLQLDKGWGGVSSFADRRLHLQHKRILCVDIGEFTFLKNNRE